ncbi:hypothetical protein BBBOND_0302890 [Babesia bigemina]|uniref:C3H1-type domain-containing protein n=1 Tax=Babesia bigemina TaxID=5866 RepID=A0A061DDM5_BABBI|nr:hypothetical protein BBBOND_0302890 [Babesia bigemina]CDR96385.1 hypothetical protein BBBOND_0302890 [Babesia bigemina]|eukprot:XP_012768571.1 hypothetical protein BBBOND_0302890 [Babesia bigemina]
MAPQFKRLTDCPENLREAIDWLIQVRHGSDGRGLGELAKALKKLIEDAIRDAYTSIISHLFTLIESFKYYECCRPRLESIDKLQNLLKEPTFLADVSLNDHLEKIKYAKELCEKHHYIESSKDTALKDVNVKLAKLKELSGNLNTFNKNSEGLLTNLCNGLSTFLGFNPSSKGYTGQGIVYSDLDRLCDGVMGFLSGVLEAVQDDDAVKTYDDNGHLNKLPQEISKKMYKGPHEFSLTLSHTGAVLGYYDAEVNRRINAVVENNSNGTLYALQSQIDKNIRNLQDSLTTKKYEDVVAQWKDVVTDGLTALIKSAESAINALDTPLKTKVANDFEKIETAVEALSESNIMDVMQLRELSGAVRDELRDLDRYVAAEIHLQVERLEKNLKQEFKSKIHAPISHVESALKTVQSHLNKWFDQANIVVSAASSKTKAILAEVTLRADGAKPTKWNNVESAAIKLQTRADELRGVAKAAKEELKSQVENALKQVLFLDRAVRKGVKTVKDNIKGALRKYIKEQLLEDINAKIKEIINGEEGDEGLKQIVDGVKKYADLFKQKGTQGFEGVVQKWIADILRKEPVKGLLNEYFQMKDRFKPPYDQWNSIRENTDITEGLARIIADQLKEEYVEKAVDAAKSYTASTNAIRSYVTVVQLVCSTFSKLVGLKIKASGLVTLADKIVRGIETGQELSITKTGHLTNDTNITRAVQHTLHQLVGVARHTGDQTDELVLRCHIGNVEVAIDVANLLEGNVGKAAKQSITSVHAISPSSALSDSIYNFEGRILGILQKDFGKDSDGDGKVETLVVKNFEDYDGLIKQSKVAGLTGDAKLSGHANEGSFPEMIKGIEHKLNGTEYLGKIESGTHRTIDPGATDSNFYDDTFQLLVGKVNRELQTLCNELRRLAEEGGTRGQTNNKGVQTLLNDLNTMLGQSGLNNGDMYGLAADLKSINADIVKILGTDSTKNENGNLTDILAEAVKFVDNTLKDGAKNCITNIKAELTKRVGLARDSIKSYALDRHVFRKRTELGKLKHLIEKQREAIISKCRIDGNTGVKGLLKAVKSQLNSALPITDRTKLDGFPGKVRDFLISLWEHVGGQFTEDNESFNAFGLVKKKFVTLLDEINNSGHFTHSLAYNLGKLKSVLDSMSPLKFSGHQHPMLLDAIKDGLTRFHEELRKAYIRVYDGSKPITWDEPFSKNTTEESRNAAKVFLTMMNILFNNLNEVKEMCNTASASRINTRTELGEFLTTCGYNVSEKGRQNGELQDKGSMQGSHIYKLLVGDGQNVYHVDKAATRALEMIYEDCLVNYYRTCHLPTPATKHPSTICDILQWLAGLPYNAVYNALSHDAFSDLFEKPEKDDATKSDTFIVSINEDPDSLPAYPETISATDLSQTLTLVCHHAEKTLIAILGHGNSDGRYACDFNANAGKFLYPSKGSQCLDLLVELLLRLYDQLYFLHVECYRTSDSVSWRDCYYGRHVAGSDWRCNDKQCVNQMGNQIADQKVNQMCGQTCDQHPKCGLKSPLQSFFEDGLPGFLPHPYKKADCKLSCAAPNHRGLLCKTPMGFADLSVKASHTKTGEYLSNVLSEFCGDAEKPLTKMCRFLICVLSRPPQTLGDMFSFYYNLLNGWHGKGKGMDADKTHKRHAFEAAVTNAYFGVNYPTFDVASVINNSKEPSEKHKDGNLLCLVGCKNSSVPSAQCGRYLQPFGINTWLAFSSENADKYLSWIVYITETFYDLLKKLYDECCNNCNKPGSRCYDKSCVKNCVASHSYIHSAGCTSIAQCPFTRPTLSKYGFVLRSISNLHGATDTKTKRTCKDLCNALKNVLNEKNVLFTLAYRTIPKFLYDIRQPFIWLTVALWLLSLLYLIHIMVIRLDLLHIKSHLHSPSSHRIAAQSLLAAARVSKLAELTYLQP